MGWLATHKPPNSDQMARRINQPNPCVFVVILWERLLIFPQS
ncbi:hypothetical protein N0824_00522 [Microcystis sp. 0824]|nr:hypothetical protein N0824_00522 [Microcystis sp. 0824]